MWKDMIYCDVSFSRIQNGAYLMRCEFVNNTDLKQNCILNGYSAMEYPKPFFAKLTAPDHAVVINANDYENYTYANPRPWDTENPDGMAKGQFSDYHFTGGFGLGDRCENYHVPALGLKPFGCEKGDSVSYAADIKGFNSPVLTVRYRSATEGDAEFTLCGKKIVFPHSEELAFAAFDLEKTDQIILQSLGTAGIELDVLVVTEKGSRIGSPFPLKSTALCRRSNRSIAAGAYAFRCIIRRKSRPITFLQTMKKQGRERWIPAALKTLCQTAFQTATILTTSFAARFPKAFRKRRAMRAFSTMCS